MYSVLVSEIYPTAIYIYMQNYQLLIYYSLQIILINQFSIILKPMIVQTL